MRPESDRGGFETASAIYEAVRALVKPLALFVALQALDRGISPLQMGGFARTE